MSDTINKIAFTGQDGLNSDVDEQLLPKGDSRYRFCCRSGASDSNNVGSIENIQGNTLAEYLTIPLSYLSGTHTEIGYCEDNKNDAIIYFINNSQNHHSILSYNKTTQKIENVLFDESVLNFDLSYKITSANVIGDLLYWTDNYNPPRKINLDLAKKYTNAKYGGPATGGYTVLTEDIINVVKIPPTAPPLAEYSANVSFTYNNLRGKLFEFSYRYIYIDFEKSVLSPHSKVPIPYGDTLVDGTYIENVSLNNVIELNIKTGDETVTDIELFVREGNSGDWYVVEKLNKSELSIASNSSYVYGVANGGGFYNNKMRDIVDQIDAARPFDYVPLLAGSQEIIDENTLVYGDIKEGYDNIDIDVLTYAKKSAQPLTESGDAPYTPMGVIPYPFDPSLTHDFPTLGPRPYRKYLVDIGDTPINGGLYRIHIGGSQYLADFKYINTLIYPSDVTTSLINQIRNFWTSLGWEIDADLNAGNDTQIYIYIDADFNLSVTGEIVVTPYTYKSFISGSYYSLGLVYYDEANRSGAVNTDKNCDIYVPSLPEAAQKPDGTPTPDITTWLGDLFDFMPTNQLYWEINHTPPVWAKKYQWLVTRSSISWLLYMPIADTVQVAESNTVGIDINSNILRYILHNPKSIISTYVWQKGDRIRFLTDNSKNILVNLDYEIVSQDTQYIYVDDFDLNRYNIDYTSGNCLVEIYRPRLQVGEKLFYEIGECFDITDAGLPTRTHSVTSGYIQGGDIYCTYRSIDPRGTSPLIAYNSPVENISESDFYQSDYNDYGRVNTVVKDMRQLTLQNIRHSKKYIQNTKVNGLSSFEYDAYVSMNEKYGTIQRLVQNSNILKVLQDDKLASIYIGTALLSDQLGTDQIIKSDKLLGSIRYNAFDYGTLNPESVTRVDNNIYFFDKKNGCYCRDAANGTFPISDYTMKTFWRDLSKKYNINVYSAYNRKYNEVTVFITYKNSTSQVNYSSYGLTFNEPSNRWKSFMPFYQTPTSQGGVALPVNSDGLAWSGTTLLSFLHGNAWIHDTNPLYNNFYGTQYSQALDIVANENPEKVKTYDTLWLNTNNDKYDITKSWSADEILVLPSENNPRGMKSRLKANKFKTVENGIYANFMRDMLTHGTTLDENDLVNGRQLRGRSMKIRLTNNNTNKVVLHSVTVNATSSELS